jgi:hypothetical protein
MPAETVADHEMEQFHEASLLPTDADCGKVTILLPWCVRLDISDKEL